MKLKTVAKQLRISADISGKNSLTYRRVREYFINRFHHLDSGKFQSPSIAPTTESQRNGSQNEKEFSVYQRSDYTPEYSEGKFNKIFKSFRGRMPKTLLFNSGMATISTVMFFLKNVKKLGTLYIGENAYFETKWLVEDFKEVKYFNEYSPVFGKDVRIFWLEYPINCTQPSKYPFDKQLDTKLVFSSIVKICHANLGQKYALVVDYTLFYLPFDIFAYLDELPKNLEVFLITSLQKHRGYGFDLTNGGALTFYSDAGDYEELKKLRAIMGTSITQETIWTMPEISPKIINKIVRDSAVNAEKIFDEISKKVYGPVKFFYSKNSGFRTSFIFVEIDKTLVKTHKSKPFLSERLVEEIVRSAKKNSAILVNGTSFGLPFTRIFKNSERYENTNSLRIAVGYDEEMCAGVAKSIVEGTENFVKSLRFT